MLHSKVDKIHPCLTPLSMFIVSVSQNSFSVGLLDELELQFLLVSHIVSHDLRSRKTFL